MPNGKPRGHLLRGYALPHAAARANVERCGTRRAFTPFALGMLAGISIFCFAASYAVALLLEGSRLFFRSGIRGAILLAFGAAGFLAHTIYLAYRAGSETVPLASEFDWYLVAAWLLAAIYLYLTLHFPRTAVGLFVLPLVLGLVAVAEKFASRQPFPQTKATQFWGILHGSFLLLGTVAVSIGFIAGLMNLVQSYRLKHKLPVRQGFQLPSLEWLERANSRATIFSALALAIGFVSGVLLNLVNRSEHPGESLPWNDPVIWSSGALLIWMLAAALFSVVYRPARQGRKVAYLTVASFLFLAAVLGYQLMAPSLHGVEAGQGVNTGQGDQETRNASSIFLLQLRPGARMAPLLLQCDKEKRRQGDKGMRNHALASLLVSLSPCPLVSPPFESTRHRLALSPFEQTPHHNGGGL